MPPLPPACRGGLDEALSRVLDLAENAAPAHAVEAVTRELGEHLGALSTSFLIADLSGRALVRLSRDPAHHLVRTLFLPGGAEEQALRTQDVVVVSHEEGWRALSPVTERGEMLGLLEMVLPHDPSPEEREELARTAHLLAFVVIANRRHTDVFEQGQRNLPFSLEAEIQRRLLPAAFTCEGGEFSLSAWLEPAQSVGGDTFDYSVGEDELSLSITDAMGHGVASALTATLCVGSLRNSRHQRASLAEQAESANAALLTHALETGTEGFATGMLARLSLHTGLLSAVNAGHPLPFLLRSKEVSPLPLPPHFPLGMLPATQYTSTDVQLSPGDRLVFVTDGLAERVEGELDLTDALLATSSLPPREATRRLVDMVLEASAGALSDDATLLILDWHGADRLRTTSAGADQ